MLKVVTALPEGFLQAQPQQLLELLGGPTLIHLPGAMDDTLFVSLLLHGNEPTGLYAVQDVLQRYDVDKLPRPMSIFVGNVYAAAEGMRRLDGQHDYNRVWLADDACPENRMMCQVVDEMRRRDLFASVDIHNNTGINPHYACVNRLDAQFMQLATMFGRTVVYFTKPEGVQSMAFATLCPSVTLECGQPGQKYGVKHAADFLDACLRLHELPNHPVSPHDLDLFHTVAVVKLPEDARFRFDGPDAPEDDVDLIFRSNIDHYNFSELEPGTEFGRTLSEAVRLECYGENGEDLGDRFFGYQNGVISLAKRVMPSMLTRDERVIRQDCFCYLMERFGVE